MGLSFARLREGGAILNGLDAALKGALSRGEILDEAATASVKPEGVDCGTW